MINDEFADVMFYLLRFADIANLDIEKVCFEKIAKNKKKYPVMLSRGTSKKYTEFKKKIKKKKMKKNNRFERLSKALRKNLLKRKEKKMGIMPDSWIRKMAVSNKMIDPFVDKLEKKNVLSYGLSSYGYDARVSRNFKVFTNVNSATVDPKDFLNQVLWIEMLINASSHQIVLRLQEQ